MMYEGILTLKHMHTFSATRILWVWRWSLGGASRRWHSPYHPWALRRCRDPGQEASEEKSSWEAAVTRGLLFGQARIEAVFLTNWRKETTLKTGRHAIGLVPGSPISFPDTSLIPRSPVSVPHH